MEPVTDARIPLVVFGACAFAYLVVLALAVIHRERLSPGRSRVVVAASLVTVLWALAAATAAPEPLIGALGGARSAAWLVVLAQIGLLWPGPRLAILGTLGVLGAAAVGGGLLVLAETMPLLLQVRHAALLVVAVAGLALLEAVLRSRSAGARWDVKHLCLGLSVAFAYDVFLYADSLLFHGLNPQIVLARGLVLALCALPMALSLTRAAMPARRLRPSRELLVKSTAVLAAGVYLLLMAAAGYGIRELGAVWGPLTQAGFLAGALLLLGFVFLSGASRAQARVWVAKNFFAHRYDYREEWLRFTRTIAGSGEGTGGDRVDRAEALHTRVVRAVCDIVEGTGGALWVHQERDRAYLPAGQWNRPPGLPALPDDLPLLAHMRRTGWVVDVDEAARHPDRYGGAALPPALTAEAGVWLVLPLLIHDSLIGFVAVCEPRVRRQLTWEDFDILKTVGSHAATTLETERALNELSDARRLEAFSKRTAFLVHDVKNITSQLDLMLRNAERVGHDPEFQKDMLSTTAGAVTKLRDLLAALRQTREEIAPPAAGAPGSGEPPGGARTPDLAGQVAAAAVRWQRRHAALHADVEPSGPDLPVPPQEALAGVLDHLVQNAIEASGAGGAVRVALLRRGGVAAVEVSDEGAGMDPETVHGRLFRPLVSGKAEGYGLGAFQAREMVREMGGRLEVDSRPGQGTTMRIVFPLLPVEGTAAGRPVPGEREVV